MRTFAVAAPLLLMLTAPAGAQSDSARAAECSTYAKNKAEMEGSTGTKAFGGAALGAAGGALFGAIIGGDAGAGAALGAIVGGVGGGVSGEQEKRARYQHYYEACMRSGGG